MANNHKLLRNDRNKAAELHQRRKACAKLSAAADYHFCIGSVMSKKLTVREFGAIKSLVAVQNELISKFGEFSKQASEPQLREAFQKLCASAKNHKRKLLKTLEVQHE